MQTIPHNQPTISLSEKIKTLFVISSKHIAQGREVAKLEEEICKFFDIEKGCCALVNNGTSALYIALKILGVTEKVVGCPVYCCSALSNAINMARGIPYYFDCDQTSPNTSLSSIECKNLSFMIAVSMYGVPIRIPKTTNFTVVEDFSQCFGAEMAGEKVGLRGEIGICSLYATKLWTTGGHGGLIVSKNSNIIEAVKDFILFDSRRDGIPRFNFHCTDIQAGFGRVQLSKYSRFISKRWSIFNYYQEKGLKLKFSKQIKVPYRALLQNRNPVNFKQRLSNLNINSILPIERSELLKQDGNFSNSFRLCESLLSIPCYPNLTKFQLKHITRSINSIYP